MDPARPEVSFDRCREVIAAGGVIVFPTDTFYGLGADARNPAAVRKLFAIKGRRADQPILVLIADPAAAAEWAAEIPRTATILMRRFWPGPLTLVFKARPDVAQELTAGTGTIGLRAPGSSLTLGLLRHLGIALTGTSANISGGPNPATAAEAMAAVGGSVDLVLDGGRTPGDRPSTVVDVSTGRWVLVREGVISAEAIREAVR